MKCKLYGWMALLVALASAVPAFAADPAHGDAHAAEAPNPFAGTPWQSLAAIVVFLLLLAILWKYAWDPILSGLQDRENKIREDLAAAEKARLDADAALKKYQGDLAAASEEARRIIDQSRTDAEKLAASIKAETEAEIKAGRDRAMRDIAAAKQTALAEIYTQTATLATDVAGKILQREIQPADQQKLIDESLAALARNKN